MLLVSADSVNMTLHDDFAFLSTQDSVTAYN